MPKLQAIFFDIDDTLYSTSEFSELARSAAIDSMIDAGLDLGREEIREELDEVIHEFSSNYEHHFDRLLLRTPQRSWEAVTASSQKSEE